MNDQSLPFEGKQPRVEVIDREKDILVRAELPGVDKSDLEISVSGEAVTISCTTRHEKKKEKDNYRQSEVSHGTFTCNVALSSNVDPDKAKTTYKDGLLELILPKVTKSKQRTIKLT